MATVLVVDDHPDNRDLLVTLLGFHGHTMLQACDGVEALRVARAWHPDLVITDLVMPVMDGYEFVRELRSDQILAATRVIFYTANYLQDEVQPIAAALGVNHIVSKPAEPESLLAVVREALVKPAETPYLAPAGEVRNEHLRVLSGKLADKVRELHATEESLKESEARFRSLTESSPVGIFSLDSAGRVSYGNPRLREICGVPAGSSQVPAWTDMLHPDESEHVLAGLAAAFESRTQYRERVRIVQPSGELRWADVQASRVPGDSQQIRYVGTVQDVTDALEAQRQREELLARLHAERTEARFRGLLEAAPDAVLCVDEAGHMVLVNAQTERLFGYQREELEGQLVEILVPDAARVRHSGQRARYAADPAPRSMDSGLQLRGRRRDGSAFPAEISLSAISTEEGTLVMATVRDVTERRRHQEELERAYRSLESFAYSVSHDLRTPLRALAGYSAALMEDCGEALGDDGRDYALRIQAASEQMATLIDDLLHLSRVSRAEISLRPVDLGAEAASIAEELARQSPDRRVRLTIQRPVLALADRSLIRTVLENLLGNAWKFTSGRDDASIEFGASAVGDGAICCHVRDNGAGFDAAYVDKLFRPFQRLHTTREFPGSGVGLASVRQVVERHGGRTWAEGTPGEGATFYFTLTAREVT